MKRGEEEKRKRKTRELFLNKILREKLCLR
jgi:hypothetical protein